jgi:hypothetical protein
MSQVTQIGRVATTVHTNEDGQTVVIYHQTPVVKFDSKHIILNHGGWTTNTTKTRMNQASNQFRLGYNVFQKDYSWFVSFKGKTIPFNEYTLTLKR